MFRKRRTIGAVLFGLAVAMSVLRIAQAFAGTKEKLLLTGSSTLAPLIGELAKTFESKEPQSLIEVQSGGSAKGISDCREKLNDLGMISRALHSDETDVKATQVAIDGIALVGHPSLKIKGLERNQIVSIFRGEIKNWKALGGPDQKIIVVNKAEGRAALELFLHYFELKADEVKADLVIGEEEQGIKTVRTTPGAIGYVSVVSALASAKTKPSLTVFSVDGKAPSVKALRTGAYPLNRPLSVISCGTEKALASEFVKYLTSTEGQKVIEKLGYIPL